MSKNTTKSRYECLKSWLTTIKKVKKSSFVSNEDISKYRIHNLEK